MKTTKQRMAATTRLILVSTLCASASYAHARTISAIDARPVDPDEAASCYRWFPLDQSSIGLERMCPGSSYVDLAIPIDTAGSKTVTVWAARPTTNHLVACNAFAVTKNGGYVPGSVIKLTTTGANFQPLALPVISVAASGSLWVRCQMSQGTRIMEVEVAEP
jgi:hypothetical protein